MKRILVTAGTVYGPLDDNKLVGNRVRGIWATRFAALLTEIGHNVTLLLADIQRDALEPYLPANNRAARSRTHIELHKGFWDYQAKCLQFAETHDTAILAGAVVNWIPEKPFSGKMPTTHLPGLGPAIKVVPGQTVMQIPFILAPRVIDQMRQVNPKLTLIGCKMTSGASYDELVDAAYKTLLAARCHAVVANDMKALKNKHIVHPDRTVVSCAVTDDLFYNHLDNLIIDVHYSTEKRGDIKSLTATPAYLFDRIVDKYRGRFVYRVLGEDRVFGAVAVPYTASRHEFVVSPREKGQAFTAKDASLVIDVNHVQRKVSVFGPKATLNAPLLVRHLLAYPGAAAILHLHEQLPHVPTVPYAPPGTVRDNTRDIPGPVYNIEGHGFIAALDNDGEIWKL